MQCQTASIVIERLLDGKMRFASNGLNQEGLLSGEQVLEVRNVDGRLHVARKQCRHAEWTPPVEPYGPYAPGKCYDVITDEGDASPAKRRRIADIAEGRRASASS